MTNTSPSSGSNASRLESCGSFTLHSYHTLIAMQLVLPAGTLVGPLDGSQYGATSCDGWANSILKAKADQVPQHAPQVVPSIRHQVTS